MNRVIRYVNALIGLLLVAALAAVYWYVWRPLPQTSGTTSARVAERVVITRDELGVPHIKASSIEDALFAQGFVTAQDRLWQMDAIRRLGSGELAEIVGPLGVQADIDARRLRLRRAAESHAKSMPSADRAVLAAYARGVNQYIDQSRANPPVEFRLLNYQPRPWSIVDSIVIGLHMHRILTTTWKDELLKSQMLENGDPAKVATLFPVRSGREVMPGSNAWAIAGALTATGKPILANDPHLEFSFPSTWYQIHLDAGRLNVIGVSLPGVPAVIIGHNRRIAWGVTNLGFDVQDLYLEKLDPTSGRYLFRGATEQARLETDRIAVKGQGSQPFQQWITRHGPASFSSGRQVMAMRWTATENNGFQFPFIDLNLAQNWTEFRAALARYPGPGQNFVFADVDGNIGYQATGRLPLRKTYNGDVPVDGASGEFEWDGYIPFEELPSAFNPSSGMVVSANQNPWPAAADIRINGEFASPYRSAQILARLRSKKGWRAEEMLGIQTDVYSGSLHSLARQIVAQVKVNDQRLLTEPIRLLREWNGQMDKDLAAPLIANLTYQHLRRMLVEKAAPGKGGAYSLDMAAAVVDHLVTDKPRDWSSDWAGFLRQALSDALEEGKRMQGEDVTKWKWGVQLQLTLAHPILSKVPYFGKYFQIGPLPMSGSSTAVKQTTRTLGPSMRFVADLSDWERSLNNITIGESGHIFSGHFKDQWDAYLSGRSFPMQYGNIAAKQTLTLEPVRYFQTHNGG